MIARAGDPAYLNLVLSHLREDMPPRRFRLRLAPQLLVLVLQRRRLLGCQGSELRFLDDAAVAQDSVQFFDIHLRGRGCLRQQQLAVILSPILRRTAPRARYIYRGAQAYSQAVGGAAQMYGGEGRWTVASAYICLPSFALRLCRVGFNLRNRRSRSRRQRRRRSLQLREAVVARLNLQPLFERADRLVQPAKPLQSPSFPAVPLHIRRRTQPFVGRYMTVVATCGGV